MKRWLLRQDAVNVLFLAIAAVDVSAVASSCVARRCGGDFEMRNRGQVMAHAGPLPHPAVGQA